MMSGQTIAAMSRAAARKSAREHQVPFTVWPEDLRDWKAIVEAGSLPRLPFPFIGDRNPRGYKRVQEFFVDSSGFGADYEPALTIRKFIGEIKENMAYAIVEVGQFQVVIAEYSVKSTS